MSTPRPRKRWSTTTIPTIPRRSHPSQAAAYRYVRARAAEFHAGMLRADFTRVTVWVDERDGRGWQRYEIVDLADLPTYRFGDTDRIADESDPPGGA